MTVRVRYAPSPTGHLHIGGVRTALFNYLFALHHGGEFIIRFEDTDLERNVEGSEEKMLRDFRWLGFEWAEGPDVGGEFGPYRCTERLDIYQKYLEQLIAAGAVYPCYCTQDELEAEREQAQAEGRMPRYGGKCRHLTAQQREERQSEGRTFNWRFAIPAGKDIFIEDGVRGTVQFQSDDIGDFVIVKSNGIPTYNFQVVIDDALMNITHVIRGEEHLSNTARQWLIYDALGFSLPVFAHLPQVLNTNRKKLSKRDPNVMPVDAYREKGFLPAAIVNFLALVGWSPEGEQEIMSLSEIAQKFTLDRVNRSGAVFDTDKLRWMAGQYVKAMSPESLTEMVKDQLHRAEMVVPSTVSDGWLQAVVGLFQEQMACAEDFVTLAKTFFQPDIAGSDEAAEILKQPGAMPVVRRYLELAEADTVWDADASRARFKAIQQELQVKGKELYMPVRAAITGAAHGPDLQQTIALTPRSWVLARLHLATSIDSQ